MHMCIQISTGPSTKPSKFLSLSASLCRDALDIAVHLVVLGGLVGSIGLERRMEAAQSLLLRWQLCRRQRTGLSHLSILLCCS